MARTKKEIEEQASTAEPETTGTVSNPIPQTDPETPPGEVANAGMTDLELAAANTLDPDAPQTDLESGEDTGDQTALPQTDPEWNPDGQSEPGEEGFAPQTEMGSPRLKTAKKLIELPRKCGFLLTISRYFVIIPL